MSASRSHASSLRPNGLTLRPHRSGNCTTTTGATTAAVVTVRGIIVIGVAAAGSTSVIPLFRCASRMAVGRTMILAAASVQAELSRAWLGSPTVLEPQVAGIESVIVARTASQHQNLQLAGGTLQDRLHRLEPGFVGVDKGVVQDQARRFALALRQQTRERDSHQHRQLLAGADAEAIEPFLRPIPAQVGKAEAVGVEDRLGAREHAL